MAKREELKICFQSIFWLLRARKAPICHSNTPYLDLRFTSLGIRSRCKSKNSPNPTDHHDSENDGALWYIQNETLQHNLQINTVRAVAQRYASSYERRPHKHPSTLAIRLLENPKVRRLKRRMPFDIA